MKKLVLNIILSLLLLNVLKVQGQDRKIPFQGTLYEEGSPFTGNIQMTFSMSHEGTKWSESHRVNVRSAVFFVVLGEKDTIPSVFFTLPDMKIEIGIGSESPLSIPLIPTPQAQYALNLTTATVTTDHFTTATPHKILATDSLGRVYWANNPTHSSVITFGQGSTSITNISGALQLTDFKTADSAAKEGMIRYNSDKHKTQIFQNGKWHIVSTQDSKFTTISQDNQSETMILGALQLSDYAGTTPKNGMLQYKNGKILIYRNGHWVNQNDRAINGLTQEDMDSLMIVRLGGELTRDTEIKTSNRKRLILSGNGGLSVQGNVFTSSNLVLGHQEMNQDGALGFSNGRFLGYSGGAWRAFSTLDTTQSTVILQDGNALSQTVKIGARDFQDLHLKVNNVTVMKFKTVGLVLGGTPSILGGFEGNTIVSNTQGAFIGGGGKEDAPNQVFGDFGVIVGGQNNQVSTTGFIGGGKHNKMDSTVLAGVIMGGVNNGIYHGGYSVIAGGYGNQVEAGHSFVAGNQAKVQKEHEGSFVWADNSGKPLMTTTPRQFMSRASGGFQFHTNPNNDDDKAVFINPGGKLGVGTSHSHAKLHVRSSPILESADENVALFESLEDHQEIQQKMC